MEQNYKHWKTILREKYKDKTVCYNCAWSEVDEQGRTYCVNTESPDCFDFVPSAHTCNCYRRKKGHYYGV